jgi:hypothetical protein
MYTCRKQYLTRLYFATCAPSLFMLHQIYLFIKSAVLLSSLFPPSLEPVKMEGDNYVGEEGVPNYQLMTLCVCISWWKLQGEDFGVEVLLCWCEIVHYSYVLRCDFVCCATRCGMLQCSVVRCSAVRCSAVQCSAVQCSAVQCSAV